MIPDKTTPDPGPGFPEQEQALQRIERVILAYLTEAGEVPVLVVLDEVSGRANAPVAQVATALSRLDLAWDHSQGPARISLANRGGGS